MAKQEFLAFYVLAGRVAAVAGMGRDTAMIYITELLAQNKMPTAADISPETDWAALASG